MGCDFIGKGGWSAEGMGRRQQNQSVGVGGDLRGSPEISVLSQLWYFTGEGPEVQRDESDRVQAVDPRKGRVGSASIQGSSVSHPGLLDPGLPGYGGKAGEEKTTWKQGGASLPHGRPRASRPLPQKRGVRSLTCVLQTP